MGKVRTTRRQLLGLGIIGAVGARAAARTFKLSVIPFYSSSFPPVSAESLESVVDALNHTYKVAIEVAKPELHDGFEEGNAILDLLYTRGGHNMAVLSCPVRAPVRNGVHATMMSVAGWADVPAEDRDRPRGAVITTYTMRNIHEAHAAKNLAVVAIHELGHNLGAWDCANNGCYMNARIDLAGSMTPRSFCDHHRELLWPYLR